MSYYDILGVPHDASQEEIRRAYREQIRFFHPDVFDGPPEIAKIKSTQLNEAYETLKDPEKRRAYDLELWAEEQARQREARQEQQAWQKEARQEQRESGEKDERGDSGREDEGPLHQDDEPRQGTDEPAHRRADLFGRWANVSLLLLLVAVFGLGMLSVSMKIRLGEMRDQNQSLLAENEALSAENDRLKASSRENETLIKEHETEIRSLKEENKRYSFSAFFVDCYVGLLFEDDAYCYHTPNCSLFKDAGIFYVLSVTMCEDMGYSPCELCHDERALTIISKNTGG